ncbi:MAG: hypothetical protein ABFR90_09850 [Planctomycetota bacterium]
MIKGWRSLHIIPRYAFQAQESFEDFYKQANTYFENAKVNDQKKTVNYKILYLLPISLSFFVLACMEHGGAGCPEYVTETEIFWQDVFASEIPQVKYKFETTDDFQEMMTEEQWDDHIQVQRDKYGEINSIYPIANIDVDKKPARAVVLHRVLGAKKSYYIRTYLVEDSIGWEINGYDFIVPVEVDFEEQEFSLEKDRLLLKGKLPYKIQITDNSVLELSGCRRD